MSISLAARVHSDRIALAWGKSISGPCHARLNRGNGKLLKKILFF